MRQRLQHGGKHFCATVGRMGSASGRPTAPLRRMCVQPSPAICRVRRIETIQIAGENVVPRPRPARSRPPTMRTTTPRCPIPTRPLSLPARSARPSGRCAPAFRPRPTTKTTTHQTTDHPIATAIASRMQEARLSIQRAIRQPPAPTRPHIPANSMEGQHMSVPRPM